MESLRNGSSPRPEKSPRRSRPLTAYGLRRLSRERLVPVEPHGDGLQPPAIVELELECGLELSGGQGVES